MTNPGQVSRLYYPVVDPGIAAADAINTGPHFSEMCGTSVGIFVPMVGVKTSLARGAISETECIGNLPHATWRSLENRRYKDMFQGSVLVQPRAYYWRIFPEPESEAAGEAFAAALVQPDTQEHAEMASRLETLAVSLLTGEGGALVSPTRVPWTVTHGYVRRRLRTNRLRLYAWTMSDDHQPLFERVVAGDREEANETPVMTFAATSLPLDESLCEHAGTMLRLIHEHRIFERVPGLREVARRYLRCSDPSRSVSTRLLEIITAFELVFGPLSPDQEQATMPRFRAVMGKAGIAMLPAKQLRTFRNAIAHGRTRDDSVALVFPHVEVAVRLFVADAVEAVANHSAELPADSAAFDAVKEIVFAA